MSKNKQQVTANGAPKISHIAPKQNRVRHGSLTADIIIYAIMIILGLLTIYPIWYVVINSFSDPQMVQKGAVTIWPIGFGIDAYKKVLASSAMIRAFFNSVCWTGIITVLNLFVSMSAGFALSKKGLVWKKGLTFFVVIPMWFSAGMIPGFINITNLGMYNTLWAIFLPSALSVYNIILCRTSIMGIPSTLYEAAEIDGATVPQVFMNIVLPLSKAIMAVVGLYTALAAWNNWFSYVLYLPSHAELHPLQYFLIKALLWGNTQSELKADMTDFAQAANRLKGAAVAAQMKYAVVVCGTFPIMCAYPFVQKYFVKGVMLGSLKE